MEIYKNLFNYMENLIKQLENKRIIKAIIRDIQGKTIIIPTLIDYTYIDSLLQQLEAVIAPERSINHRTIKDIIEDIEKQQTLHQIKLTMNILKVYYNN